MRLSPHEASALIALLAGLVFFLLAWVAVLARRLKLCASELQRVSEQALDLYRSTIILLNNRRALLEEVRSLTKELNRG